MSLLPLFSDAIYHLYWNSFVASMVKVSALGDDTYGHAAGPDFLERMYAYLATTEEGCKVLKSSIDETIINSKAFAAAFKTIAAMDPTNSADYTTPDVGNPIILIYPPAFWAMTTVYIFFTGTTTLMILRKNNQTQSANFHLLRVVCWLLSDE